MAKTIGLTFPTDSTEELETAVSADDNGFDIGSASKKADIIQAIMGRAGTDTEEV